MLLRAITTTALLALSLTAAHADDASIVTTKVAFGDLNLSQPADAKVLADRLQDAAKSVCLKANPEIGSSDMEMCVDASISVAMAQIEDRLDQNVRSNLVNVRVSMETP